MAGPRQAADTSTASLEGARVLIVEARYYEAIADALLAGATRALQQAQVEWTVVTVPGALEVPQAVALSLEAAGDKPFDGVVALGCVIRGETSHYDIVAGESARALMDLAVARKLPVGNGILTVDTEEQAWARARPEGQDKGGVAAAAALALIRLKRGGATPGTR
jgi:6,7-dimethyl-8-ribityllumazine synthase